MFRFQEITLYMRLTWRNKKPFCISAAFVENIHFVVAWLLLFQLSYLTSLLLLCDDLSHNSPLNWKFDSFLEKLVGREESTSWRILAHNLLLVDRCEMGKIFNKTCLDERIVGPISESHMLFKNDKYKLVSENEFWFNN